MPQLISVNTTPRQVNRKSEKQKNDAAFRSSSARTIITTALCLFKLGDEQLKKAPTERAVINSNNLHQRLFFEIINKNNNRLESQKKPINQLTGNVCLLDARKCEGSCCNALMVVNETGERRGTKNKPTTKNIHIT